MGRVWLPRSAEVGLERGFVGFELRRAVECARLERQARGLPEIGLTLGRVRVLLPNQRGFLRDDGAVLEGDGAVAENEVDGTHNG